MSARDERDALDRLIDALYERREHRTYRRLWAAVMLTPHVEVCESICRGRPVPVARLEEAVLRRAFRGEPIPGPAEWLTVTGEHLDAIAEAGPLGGI